MTNESEASLKPNMLAKPFETSKQRIVGWLASKYINDNVLIEPPLPIDQKPDFDDLRQGYIMSVGAIIARDDSLIGKDPNFSEEQLSLMQELLDKARTVVQ
jgi:hypothetical protein